MECTLLPTLPKLGWIARLDRKQKRLRAFHGASVESNEQWLVEGVWGGDFERGQFHKSESFFGSGIRLDGGSVHLVASTAPIDRLIWCLEGEDVLVSNSLLILLGATGAALDETHDYHRESLSLLKGINGYRKEFSVVHPTIATFYQVFMENVVISEKGIKYKKRFKLHEIRSFDDYHGLLTEALGRIKQNYDHSDRKVPISTFTAISSGYDSTAVTCLARSLGVTDCFTYRRAYSMIPGWLPGGYVDDDGTPAASQLGMHIHYLEPPQKIRAQDELYFLALPYARFSDWALSEVTFHFMTSYIEKRCEAGVVFCGYHGDKIWDIHTSGKYLSRDIIRGDTSGLNLTEIRLKAGFINVAVPFLFARNLIEIVNVGRSGQMSPWRLNNAYDRPVPRRIAESAGVSRNAFGMRKKAVCSYFRYPNNPELRCAFFRHLESNYDISRQKVYLSHVSNQTALFAQKALTHLKLRSSGYSRNLFMKDLDMPFLMWLWSAGILSRQFTEKLYPTSL